ncbi:PLAC8 family-domain-containing protein [Podospora aff. communis PSN243]|uniref:PLAC8 family-domain-containing protein n=1 Tax=Podospora aff. communis PSN243 TaxID=3040156 RepID=A0AAV9GWW4_9PEZI|nr:PLAC8 family-domain-containing protein [Podospora aff. communis PSN243]
MSHSRRGDWTTHLCYPGDENADCPRSCFIGCDQFGRTRHRLVRLDQGQDPLDLSNYKGFNSSCWTYFSLCIGSLYIGSGIYTGKQTKRIRERYNIEGTYCDDVVKGIFCQPCSLIRNDIEIRRREKVDNRLELAGGLRPPIPIGEENYRPIFAMPSTEGYRREPYMTTANIPIHQGREPHHHPGLNNAGANFQAVPLYPTEEEIREHERRWKDLGSLPETPHVASPLERIERRSQLLTPISEQDSLEDQRLRQMRESLPRFPQVRYWLGSISPSVGGKPTDQRPVLIADPGSSSAVVSPQVRKYPEAYLNPETKPETKPEKKQEKKSKTRPEKKPGTTPDTKQKTSLKLSRHDKVKAPNRTPEKLPALDLGETEGPRAAGPNPKKRRIYDAAKKAPEILPKPITVGAEGLIAAGPVVEPVEVRHAPKHNLSVDAFVTSPSELQRLHSLQADLFVASPSKSQQSHSLKGNVVVSNVSGSPTHRSLQADPRISTAYASVAPEHGLEAEKLVQVPPSTGADRKVSAGEASVRQHSLGLDRGESVGETSVHQHSIHSDEFITVEEESEPESARSEPERQGHDILQDPEVTIDVVAAHRHSIKGDKVTSVEKESVPESARSEPKPQRHNTRQDPEVTIDVVPAEPHGIDPDTRVPTPILLQRRPHSLTRDVHITTPSRKGPRSYGIHLDEGVPTQELVRFNLEHDIRQDRDFLTPSPASRQRDLQEDERIGSSGQLRPRLHSIRSDPQVHEPSYQTREHDIESDYMVAVSNGTPPRDQSLNADKKVTNRAYRLLESFLGQDSSSASKGSK